jgi:hypothetical protein
MYEHYRQPLLPLKAFYRRLLRSLAFSFLLLSGTVLIGLTVFHYLEGFSATDAFLNCVLIMTGVGTVGDVNSTTGKIFTGVYAVLSTLIFFTILAIIFTPLLHRLLHKLHLDLEKKG